MKKPSAYALGNLFLALGVVCIASAIGVATMMLARRPEPIMPEIVQQPLTTPDDVRDYWVRVYAERFETDARWVSAISHAENTRGLHDAWSPNRCCVGPMQVHIRWTGRFDTECEGSDLLNARVNRCYGVLIWKQHLGDCRGVVECALRDYVGQEDNIVAGDRYVADVYNNWLEGI